MKLLGWKGLLYRRKFHRLSFIFNYITKNNDFIYDNIKHEEIHAHNTRNKSMFSLPTAKTNLGKSKSAYMFFNEWNSLNGSLKTSVNSRIFKKQYFNNI